MKFNFSWSEIWVGCNYFVFWLSSYGRDYATLSYWKGVAFFFRFPWEPIKEGECYPHGFKIVTDQLDEYWQELSLGRRPLEEN